MSLTIEQREQMDRAANRWTVVRQLAHSMSRLNVDALEPAELAVLIGAIETFADRVHLAGQSNGVKLWACPSCDTGTQCGHDPQGIVGPMYLFPPAKPAPPTSRETLAANVERLRICKFWSIRDLATRAAEIGGMGIEHWIWSIEALDDESLEDPSFRIAGLDALAAAFDTSPAALLTPQETQA